MNRYVAFLRAINLGGDTKVSMSELKEMFANMGFQDIVTVLNSGNILFSTDADIGDIRTRIETELQSTFGFAIPVHVIELDSLREILSKAPTWWNTDDKTRYHNLIFIIGDETVEEIFQLIGETSVGKENAEIVGDAIFWSYDLSCYQKCNWWKKTAKKGIAEKLTIRTGNTIKKICR